MATVGKNILAVGLAIVAIAIFAAVVYNSISRSANLPSVDIDGNSNLVTPRPSRVTPETSSGQLAFVQVKQVAAKVESTTTPAQPASAKAGIAAVKAALATNDPASVYVQFPRTPTLLGSLSEGVKYFTNRDYKLQQIPEELIGLEYTRRGGGRPC